MTFAYRFTEISFLYFPNQSVHGDAAVWRKVAILDSRCLFGFRMVCSLAKEVLLMNPGFDLSWLSAETPDLSEKRVC